MSGINSSIAKVVVVSVIIFIVSCATPRSKEAFIGGFEKFVNRVEQNHEKYNKKDWNWANTRFEKYNKDWYSDYKEEFTLQEQIKIKTLVLEYNSYKNNEDLGAILKELFEEDVEGVKDKIEDYIENSMEGDLDNFLEGATEIGDSAVKVLEDIIDKLDNTF